MFKNRLEFFTYALFLDDLIVNNNYNLIPLFLLLLSFVICVFLNTRSLKKLFLTFNNFLANICNDYDNIKIKLLNNFSLIFYLFNFIVTIFLIVFKFYD